MLFGFGVGELATFVEVVGADAVFGDYFRGVRGYGDDLLFGEFYRRGCGSGFRSLGACGSGSGSYGSAGECGPFPLGGERTRGRCRLHVGRRGGVGALSVIIVSYAVVDEE